MNTMKFPRDFVEQLTPAQRIELARNPIKFAAALHDFEVAREGDADATLDAPKPASAYVDIPDWLEAEIKALDADNIAYFAADLSQSLAYGDWNHRLDNKASIGDSAYELLEFSDRDVFKGLLQWVAMELI